MKETIVIGALLHDIGKFIYRALEEGEFRREFRHQELGEKWAKEAGLSDEIATIIKRHHLLNKNDKKYEELSVDSFKGKNTAMHNVLRLVCAADNLAAGMERKGFDAKEGFFDRLSGLKTVFSNISLNGNGPGKTANTVWEPRNIADLPYPIKEEEVSREKLQDFYSKGWHAFRKEFNAMKQKIIEDTLLILLQKYTLMIPEHTLVTSGGPSDTSLYHHMKSTAAIAWCIYKYLVEEKGLEWDGRDLTWDINNADDEKFLLIAGDISGIQNFIYTISSENALKTVRARSFYLELLSESIVSHLVEELDLCRSCIIYNSGGGFYLLAPNTTGVRQKIHNFVVGFNRFLYDEFGFSLCLLIAAEPLKGKDLKGEKGEENDGKSRLGIVWSNLKKEMGRQKGRKWLDLFENDFENIFKPETEGECCEVCHQPLDGKKREITDGKEDETKLCSFCAAMIELGKKLPNPNLEHFYEVNEKEKSDISLEIFGRHYLFDEPRDRKNIKCRYMLKRLWEITGSSYPERNFPLGSYFAEKSFEDLAKAATGFEKLGTLRMDVDFLGRIFSRGLGENITFARLNDLSERMNLYFKYYLPAKLEQGMKGNISKITRDSLMVYPVYSGGDDLFLVGAWDSALDAACLIYSDFKKYTGYNPDLTLSGGLTITDEKVAFYRIAEAAGKEEKKAKSNERDSLSIFGFPLKWHEVLKSFSKNSREVTLEYLLDILIKGADYDGKRYLPRAYSRSFVQKLLYFLTYYYDSPSVSDDERHWFFPQIHYYMKRVIESDRGKKYKNDFYRPLFSMMLAGNVLEKKMIPALKIVDYLTRGGKE